MLSILLRVIIAGSGLLELGLGLWLILGRGRHPWLAWLSPAGGAPAPWADFGAVFLGLACLLAAALHALALRWHFGEREEAYPLVQIYGGFAILGGLALSMVLSKAPDGAPAAWWPLLADSLRGALLLGVGTLERVSPHTLRTLSLPDPSRRRPPRAREERSARAARGDRASGRRREAGGGGEGRREGARRDTRRGERGRGEDRRRREGEAAPGRGGGRPPTAAPRPVESAAPRPVESAAPAGSQDSRRRRRGRRGGARRRSGGGSGGDARSSSGDSPGEPAPGAERPGADRAASAGGAGLGVREPAQSRDRADRRPAGDDRRSARDDRRPARDDRRARRPGRRDSLPPSPREGSRGGVRIVTPTEFEAGRRPKRGRYSITGALFRSRRKRMHKPLGGGAGSGEWSWPELPEEPGPVRDEPSGLGAQAPEAEGARVDELALAPEGDSAERPREVFPEPNEAPSEWAMPDAGGVPGKPREAPAESEEPHQPPDADSDAEEPDDDARFGGRGAE